MTWQSPPASRSITRYFLRFLRLIAWALIPLIFLQALRLSSGATFSWGIMVRQVLFVLGVLILSGGMRAVSRRAFFPPLILGLLILGGAALLYAISLETGAAWVFALVLYAFLIFLDDRLSYGINVIPAWLIHLFLAGVAGGATTAVLQIEERFSEEEFFALLQLIALSSLFLLASIAFRKWSHHFSPLEKLARKTRLLIGLGLALISAAGSVLLVRAYQHSFYPDQAPAFPGITQETPFICGQAPASVQTYEGEDVFNRLLERVEANPQKGTLEYGLLSFGKSGQSWAELFHRAIIGEARQSLFTQAENSVKYGQCQAALRVYFYSKVRDQNPALFNPSEQEEIAGWFAAINRRALQIGWVDWMYALAFNKWPSGPYENQECGAGLLAILEATGLADPNLSHQNRAYLSANPRGWLERFRNTDDTYTYQPEWILHAWFESMYSSQLGLLDNDQLSTSRLNEQLSLEWFLLQALPDGSPLRYNHVNPTVPGLTAYWGASMVSGQSGGTTPGEQDLAGASLWLAGRSADYLDEQGGTLYAQTGVTEVAYEALHSPTWGSCLLYSNAGLSKQSGPLAPDKIVFRDGWEKDSAYLLLNLRFTGWHRYKATNSVILAYQTAPIAAEVNTGELIPWLPRGRSLLRDKRIPRENLNGLLVERTGMSALTWELAGIGGRWAQDPPYFARVKRFETGPEKDVAETELGDWRGWNQDRTIIFSHNGPVVISDRVSGPTDRQAALSWHFAGQLENESEGRFLLRGGDQPVEILLLRTDRELDPGELQTKWDQESGYTDLVYQPHHHGGFSLLTIMLTSDWVGADASLDKTVDGIWLGLQKGERNTEFLFKPISVN